LLIVTRTLLTHFAFSKKGNRLSAALLLPDFSRGEKKPPFGGFAIARLFSGRKKTAFRRLNLLLRGR
jgi:hypothetical protein